MAKYLTFAVLAFLVVRTSWARGGTTEAGQGHLLWTALLLVALLLPAVRQRYGNWRTTCYRLVADPVLWVGSLFLVLLMAQWLNAGQAVFFNPIHDAWETTTPTPPWVPFAFVGAEALEMLRWFTSAVFLLLAMRHGLGRFGKRALVQILVFNGACLACFGIVRYFSGADDIYGQVFTGHFFATFGYPNHAGGFFVLSAALALGCLFRVFEKNSHTSSTPGLVLWGGCFIFSFFGAILSLSRAAMGGAVGLLVVGGIVLVIRFWPDLRPVQRLNVCLATGAFVCLCFFLYDGIASQAIKSEWGIGGNAEKAERRKSGKAETPKFYPPLFNDCVVEENTETSPLPPPATAAPPAETFQAFSGAPFLAELNEGRIHGRQAAVGIWREYPWFGCGGWGFRHLLITQLPPDARSMVDFPGQANTHCDPLQFLAEFGLVGFGLMCMTVLALLLDPMRKGYFKHKKA